MASSRYSDGRCFFTAAPCSTAIHAGRQRSWNASRSSTSTVNTIGACAAKRSVGGARRGMVDRDVVLRKCETIEHHASRLRAKQPLAAAALEADESLRNDVCFDLLQAVQACIDLAVHACTHDS